LSIRRFFKVKSGLVSINNFRKFIGWEVFWNAVRNDFRLRILSDLPRGKVLVLAPHPDDDILGCGGAICKHKKSEDHVRIVFLTDGSGGGREIRLTSSERKKLVVEREEEARQAAEIIGAKDLEFWRYRDNELISSGAIIRLLSNLIERFSPEIIYVPSFLDPHPDHWETAKVFALALKELKDFKGRIFSYETWLPLYANRIVIINAEIKKKTEALRQHKSQLDCREYLEGITGLNRYRGGMFGAGKYAEGFFETDKKLFLQLFELIEFEK